MAEELGVATLLIGVNTANALAALDAFKTKAESILSSTNTNAFSGLAKGAEAAGKEAGDKLAKGLKTAVSGLKFDNIAEALSFGDALNGTIADLDTYKKALIALRDTTKATTPGFNELNAQIEATAAQIKALTSSTDSFGDLLNRVDAAKFADGMKAWAAALRENDTALRNTAGAIRDAEGALNSYDKASREAVKASEAQVAAARELRDAYLGVASAAAGAVAKGVGGAINLGKGVVGTAGSLAKGAINAGKAGYDIGAELGIFEEPKTGPFKQAIQGVIDRFAFLGKQAQTTRGVILRAIEGLGTGVGINQLVDNIDILKKGLSDLSTTSTVTNSAFQGLNDFGSRIAETWNSAGWLTDNGNTLIGKILNISSAAEGAAAGTTGLTDAFIQLGTQGLSGALDGLEILRNLVTSIPPEAAALTVAITGVVALLKNPIEASLKNSLIDLGAVFQMVEEEALQTSNRLQNFYENLSKSPQLALPSTEILQPEKNGLQRLDPQNNSLINAVNQTLELRRAEKAAADEAQRLSDALDTNRNIGELLPNAIERGARWFQKQAEYAQRVAEYSKSATDNQLKPSLNGEFSRIPVATTGAKNIYPAVPPPVRKDAAVAAKEEEEEAKRLRDLHRQAADEVRKRRIALQEAAKAAKDEAEAVKKGAQQRAADSVDALRDSERQQRLTDEKAKNDRVKKLKDITGSALIGGAFPALFGQGAGASVGGGLGGALGGAIGGQFGFGLSLVGTQLGQFIDDAVKKTAVLADALKDPIAAFDQLKEAALLSSKGLENNIASLIKAGRQEEAAALIRGDIAQQYGNGEEFKKLQDAYDEVSRSLTRLGVSLAEGLAPALTAAANAIAFFINKLSAVEIKQAGKDIQQAKGFIGNDPSRQAEFDKIYKDKGGKYGESGKFAEGYWKIAAEASRELLNNNGQLTDQQRAQVTSQQALTAAVKRTKDLRQIERDLVTATAQKDRTRVYDLERQKLAQERDRDLALAPKGDGVAAEKIRYDYGLQLLKLEQERTQEIEEQRRSFIQAYRAAQDASTTLINAQLKLQQLRGTDSGGLNKFLNPEARNARELASYNQILPKFLDATKNVAGVDYSQFSKGSLSDRNQNMLDFIQALQQENQASTDITRAQENYAQAQTDLARATDQLTGSVPLIQQSAADVVTRLEQLVAKDWAVGVTVNRDTGAVAVSNAYQR